MEADKQSRSTRKRRRLTGSDANSTNESVLSDDAGTKHYSIRSRRTQTKTANDIRIHVLYADESPGILSGNENEESPSSPSAVVTVVPAHTASPLQQATRELHARIMSRVRDLAPSFATSASKPPPITLPPVTPPPITPPTTPVPKANTDTSPTAIQSTPSPTNTNSAASIASKNTTRTVKELQHLISQYVQQQRVNLGLKPPSTGVTSPTSNPNNASPNTTPRNVPTAPNFSNVPSASNIPHVINVHNSPSVSSVSNASRLLTDINQNGIINDDTFQKSSIIANKFSSAINKYARSPHALNSTMPTSSNTNNLATHPAPSSSHYPANGGKPSNLQIIRMGHHENGPSATRSVTSSSRPVVTSVLDKNVPSLHIQYKHNQKEKRRKTEYGYYDDTSSSSSDGNTNYFLLAAQHELQNMDEEIAAKEQVEVMEDEIERLQRAVAMRDRVIRKLHDDIEEKDAIIRALPYELVSNWVAASRMMMGQ